MWEAHDGTAAVFLPSSARRTDLDFVKGIFIYLVVLGHCIGGNFAAENGIAGYVHYFIYSIHMPAFVFISGICSKNKNGLFVKVVRNLGIPYQLFDFLYRVFSLFVFHTYSFNLWVPTSVYWYIPAIAFMRLLLPFLDRHKVLIAVFLIASLCSGLLFTESDWRILSLYRVVLLMPIFLAGYYCPMDLPVRLSGRTKRFLLIGAVVCMAAEWLLLRLGAVGLGNATHDYGTGFFAGCIKFIYLLMTAVIVTAIWIHAPKNSRIAKFGKNSIVIYLLHEYFVLLFQKILPFSSMANGTFYFFICFAACGFITVFLGNNISARIYQSVMAHFKSLPGRFCNRLKRGSTE